MRPSAGQQPIILIDLVKPRIRIHKSTLHVLGDPEYIYLLINPSERLLAIKAASRTDPRAHHVSWSAVIRKSSFEIYSSALMGKLRSCSDWVTNHRYRIYGHAVEGYDVVQFRIDDALMYSQAHINGLEGVMQ